MPLPFSIDAATPPQTAAGRPGSPAFGEAVPVLRRHFPLRRLPPHGFPQDHPAARPGPAPLRGRQAGTVTDPPPVPTATRRAAQLVPLRGAMADGPPGAERCAEEGGRPCEVLPRCGTAVRRPWRRPVLRVGALGGLSWGEPCPCRADTSVFLALFHFLPCNCEH